MYKMYNRAIHQTVTMPEVKNTHRHYVSSLVAEALVGRDGVV